MLSCFASPKGASCKRTKSPGLVLSIQPNWYQSVGRMFLWTGLKRWISGDEIDHLTSYAMETDQFFFKALNSPKFRTLAIGNQNLEWKVKVLLLGLLN